MRYLISGPTSELGMIFIVRLLELKQDVHVLHYMDPQIPGAKWVYWQLGEPIPGDQASADIFIHCAFDRSSLFSKNNCHFNNIATMKLLDSLTSKQRFFLPASHSAAFNTLSYYGKSKHLQQDIVRMSGQYNFYVGYFFNAAKKSVFQIRYLIMSLLPVLFVPRKKQMTIVVTEKKAVRDFIDQLHCTFSTTEIVLDSHLITFRKFLRENGFRGAFIPIPDCVFVKFLQFLRSLRLPIVSSAADSLLSLLHND